MHIFTLDDWQNAISLFNTKGKIYESLIGSKAPSSTMLSDFKRRASHFLGESFDNYYRDKRFFTILECPVCTKTYKCPNSAITRTCGYACSNTLFRSGKGNPNHKAGNNYRTKCFLHHKKECIICGESVIVEVHHYNESHEDNRAENLVPLCPTHHKYYHSGHRHLVSNLIDEYVSSYILKNKLT